MRIEDIQYYCTQSKIKWYKHVLERMQERDISRADVKKLYYAWRNNREVSR